MPDTFVSKLQVRGQLDHTLISRRLCIEVIHISLVIFRFSMHSGAHIRELILNVSSSI